MTDPSSMDLQEIRGRLYDLAILMRWARKLSFVAAELDAKFLLHYGSPVPTTKFGFDDLTGLLNNCSWFARSADDPSRFVCILRENYQFAYKVPKNPNETKIEINLERESWFLQVIKKELEPDPPAPDPPAPVPVLKMIYIKQEEPDELPPPASPDPSPPASPPREAVQVEAPVAARVIPPVAPFIRREDMRQISAAISQIQQKRDEAQKVAEKQASMHISAKNSAPPPSLAPFYAETSGESRISKARSVRSFRPVKQECFEQIQSGVIPKAHSVRSFRPVAQENAVRSDTIGQLKTGARFYIPQPSLSAPNAFFSSSPEEPTNVAVLPLRHQQKVYRPLPYERKLSSPHFKERVNAFLDRVISCLEGGLNIGIDRLKEIYRVKHSPHAFVQEFRVLFEDAPFKCLEILSGFKIVVEQHPENLAHRVSFRLATPQKAPSLACALPEAPVLPPVNHSSATFVSSNNTLTNITPNVPPGITLLFPGHGANNGETTTNKEISVVPSLSDLMPELIPVTVEMHFRQLFDAQISSHPSPLGPAPPGLVLNDMENRFVQDVGGILEGLGGRARFDEMETEFWKKFNASFADWCAKLLPLSFSGPFSALRLMSDGRIETEIMGPRSLYFHLKHPIDVFIDGVVECLRNHGGSGSLSDLNTWFKQSYHIDFSPRSKVLFGEKHLKMFREYVLLSGKLFLECEKGHWMFGLTRDDLTPKKFWEAPNEPQDPQSTASTSASENSVIGGGEKLPSKSSVIDALMDRILVCLKRLGGKTTFGALTKAYELEVFKHPFYELIIHLFGSWPYKQLASVANPRKKFILSLDMGNWTFKLPEEEKSPSKVPEKTKTPVGNKHLGVHHRPISAANPKVPEEPTKRVGNKHLGVHHHPIPAANPIPVIGAKDTNMAKLPSLMGMELRSACHLKPKPQLTPLDKNILPQPLQKKSTFDGPSRFGELSHTKVIADRIIACLRKVSGYRITAEEMATLYKKTHQEDLKKDLVAAFGSSELQSLKYDIDLMKKVDIYNDNKKGWMYRLEPSQRPNRSRSPVYRRRRATTVFRKDSRERSRRSPIVFRSRRSPRRSCRSRSRSRERRTRLKRSPSPRRSRRSSSRDSSRSFKNNRRSRRCTTTAPSRRSRSRSRHRSSSKERRTRSKRSPSPRRSSRSSSRDSSPSVSTKYNLRSRRSKTTAPSRRRSRSRSRHRSSSKESRNRSMRRDSSAESSRIPRSYRMHAERRHSSSSSSSDSPSPKKARKDSVGLASELEASSSNSKGKKKSI